MVSHSLGQFPITVHSFPNLEKALAGFQEAEFKKLSSRKKFHRINKLLLQLIQEAPKESFLLPAVVNFIDKIKELDILNEGYHISFFESWLNQFSELSDDENYQVRGKIAGKLMPRDDYQLYFPIGMGKNFSGTHFVAAHLSPDVDTMVASFWGWLDAFAARVGTARHVWSLPGGPPDSPTTKTFQKTFGHSVFDNVPNVASNLSLMAVDLVTQKGVQKRKGNETISSIDLSSNGKAIILVDEKGHFLGDWHSTDLEPIRKIIIRFKSCLRWFETNLHVKLILMFAKQSLNVKDLSELFSTVFDAAINTCEPAKEFTEKQKDTLNQFFHHVIGLEKGLNGTFRELIEALAKKSVLELSQFQAELESLKDSDLFDKSGVLIENRPAIFTRLEKIIHQLDNAIHSTRDYVEQLNVALSIKNKVLGLNSPYITNRNDVEDIRIRIENRDYLTVVIPEGENQLFPVGVVWANQVNKQVLGTVTFRDFCNEDEVKMASYLSPISVVDHHKTALKTSSPPMAIISDAQSCNVLLAELAFRINDRYGQNGMTLKQIEEQIELLRDKPITQQNGRILQKLLKRRDAAHFEDYYINPEREFAEYYFFLLAILDDTDLLTKVSKRDVECVAELLNRMKSLSVKQEVEVINLDGIANDQHFAKIAAKKILQNQEMYSVYNQIYKCKEDEVEHNLEQCEQQHCEFLFADTKEQNGCCRVGQTKLFTVSLPTFLKNRYNLMEYWLKAAQKVNTDKPLIDLHMHMVSTIASAQEVYEDKVGHYSHQDQLWFWVPANQKAYDHLISFLTAFLSSVKLGAKAKFEFLPGVSEEVQLIIQRNSMGIPCEKVTGPALPIVILQYAAGTLNSRKAMITPYLPKVS